MSQLLARPLLRGDVVRVDDVTCAAPRSGPGALEHSGGVEIIVPRRGVFVVHRGSDAAVADPTTAIVLGPGDEFTVSHPVDGGDRCTAIGLGAEDAEEILGPRRGAVRLRPETQLAVALLTGALDGRPEDPAADEASIVTVAAVAVDVGTARPAGATAAARRRAREVQALLADAPATNWRLATIARAVHTSPFHLARQFRAATGTTIATHLLRIRLGLALDRLADGEEDLGRLAVELGFAHHSHFTARFRSVFGTTPARARDVRAGELRTILTARLPLGT